MASDARRRREESLGQAMDRIRQHYGAGSVHRLDEQPRVAPGAAISTGSLGLDLALGGGGYPRGRICELFGSEGAGKTTLGLHLLAGAQRDEGLAGFIDAEHAFDPTYARRIGLRLSDLVVSQPDHGEQAFEVLAELIAADALDAIVVDSVAALVPREELEEGAAADPTSQARMMSRHLRRIAATLGKTRTALLFVNQMRDRVGQELGPRQTTPGGRALRFTASIRVQLETAGALLEGERRVGQRVCARVVKNKLAPPFRGAEFDILFGRGIQWARDVLAQAQRHGLVGQKQGQWWHGDTALGRSHDEAVAFLEAHPGLLGELERGVSARYAAGA